MKQSEFLEKFDSAIPRKEQVRRIQAAREYDKRENPEQQLINLRIQSGLIGPAERAELQKRKNRKRYERRKTRNV